MTLQRLVPTYRYEKQKSFINSPFNGIECVVHLGLVMGRVNLAEDRFQNHLQK